jgi:hypothetical protein
MTPDELNKHEIAARDVINTLGQLSHGVRASPDFPAQVMARAEPLLSPRQRFLHWLIGLGAWQVPLFARVAVAVVFVLAVIGAVPQYVAWINAYGLGVSPDSIHEARVQEWLWEKNFACATQIDRSSSDYATLIGDYVNVVVWACPSGDVLVVVESPTSEQISRRSVWVALEETLQRPKPRLSLAIQQAFAQERRGRQDIFVPQFERVICQRWLPNKAIKRRIQLANGRCRDEVINPRNGRVSDRGEAPCTPAC